VAISVVKKGYFRGLLVSLNRGSLEEVISVVKKEQFRSGY